MRAYLAYRESGIPFLGPIPSHWTTPPAIALADVRTSTVDKKSYGGEIPVALCNYTDVYYRETIEAGPDFMEATASPDQIRQFSVRAGDVAITKDSETSDDIGIPAFVPRDIPGMVYGYHLSVYRPKDRRYSKFLKWVFDSAYVKSTFETRTPGVTRVGLSQNTLRYFRVPAPSPDEALQIADFLDRETADIDAFIADQNELIALLTERRAATITHAVTNGIEQSAPLKESGIAWLGRIPSHWELSKIKHIGESIIGLTYDPDDVVLDNVDSTIVLRSGNIQHGRIDVSRDVVRVRMSIPSHLRTREGDILLCARNGSRALVGKNAVIEGPAVGETFGAFMSVLRTQDFSFVRWILESSLFSSQMGLFSTSTVNQLTKATLDNFDIPWPDSAEREEIAHHLERECSAIDAALADAREAIALSRERRAALISAAVTGKIDVRSAA